MKTFIPLLMALLLNVMLMPACLAESKDWLVDVNAGLSHLSFKKDASLDDDKQALGVAYNVGVGYVTPVNIVIQAKYFATQNQQVLENAFEDEEEKYTVSQWQLGVGYRAVFENLTLTPMVSYQQYRYKAVQYKNDKKRKQIESDARDGTTAELALSFKPNKLVGLKLSIMAGWYHFGQMQSIQLGPEFRF